MKSNIRSNVGEITVSIPLKFERRGGRKSIIGPMVDVVAPVQHDNALIKALARAHRWRRMIETGRYPSITELAKAEKINQSYACRILRLTLLSPAVVNSILDGRQPSDLTIKDLTKAFPIAWSKQKSILEPKGQSDLSVASI